MKLYLSSYRIPTPQDLFDLVGKSADQTTVAIITNAKDYKVPAEYQAALTEAKEYFDSLRVTSEFIDLREYNDTEELLTRLQAFDVIWGYGGNTFILRYEMQRSGFDQVVRELLDAGKVYGGESAGAIVVGTTLKGIELADDPDLAERVIWDGIGLIDKAIVPHADSPDPLYRDRIAKIAAQYADTPDEVIILGDKEAWVVNGSDARKVTAA